jgi:SPX domain protein involved in polyphosphate accumulation
MFRVEDKIPLNCLELLKAKTILEKNRAKILYPRRLISSTYFDNFHLDMFLESEEGISPRKKIRIRTYNNSFKKILLEKKITSPEGRYKSSEEITDLKMNFYLKNGLLDKDYGQCFPITEVVYYRDYYSFKNVRITIDSNIKFRQFSKKNFISSDKNVMEFKPNKNDNLEIIENLIPGRKARFSKYVFSVLDNQLLQKRNSIFVK